MTRVLFIRADANSAIGNGHVMRCLALAQAWQRAGGRVVLASVSLPLALRARLHSGSCETVEVTAEAGTSDDALQTIARARAAGAEWIVADGYKLSDDWQSLVKEAGFRLFVCDDHRHARHLHANIVWNQNPAFKEEDYAIQGQSCRLLLGTQFTLLRREFEMWREWRREYLPCARKVLVTLGGSDPDNVTSKVIAALRLMPDVEAKVVVGSSNAHLDTLRAAAAGIPHVLLTVDPTNMPELMAWAEVAVAAAGSTGWELAFMGLPALQTVLAENQANIACELERRGVSINLGDHRGLTVETIADRLHSLLHDQALREEMSQRGRALVDGHGAGRVAAALGARLNIALVSDADSWSSEWLPALKAQLESAGHTVQWLHDPAKIPSGDLTFMLSLGRIVTPEVLRRNAHNLVVHASALPQGRGWSPLTWQVLEGKSVIPFSLLEAGEKVDSGVVYLQNPVALQGHELVAELRTVQAAATARLCLDFVARYPFIIAEGRTQSGEPSYYPRRRPTDSRLDPDKSLREQFNLLRVADPDRYPAYFEIEGRRYNVRVTASVYAAQTPSE